MKLFTRDAIERVVATYVEVFLGLLLANWTGTISLDTVKVAAVAAIPAVLSAIKTLVAGNVPNTISPASFVKDKGTSPSSTPPAGW